MSGTARPSLARNTAFNVGASLVTLAVGVVLSPVLLATLGLERFGFWSLLWAIAGSLALLDLRLTAAVTPLVAMAWARGERDRLERLTRTGLVVYAALGVVEVGVVALAVGIPWLAAWIPEAFRAEGRFALVTAVAVFALGALTGVFTALLHALERFDLTAKIAMAVTALRGVGLVAVALGGGGLRELLLVEAAVAVVQGLATALAARRLLPGLSLLGSPDRGALRELVAFGGKLQVAHVAHLVSLHGDKLLLSAFLGLGAVAYYELGAKVAYLMRALPLLLISATLPHAAVMEAAGDRDRLWRFYLAGTRVLLYAGTPVFVFTATGAADLLLAWAGVTAVEARTALWLLGAGFYVNLVSGMANHVAVGMGRPELEMRRSILAGTLNLVLSAALIPLLGFAGAPLGTALALVAGAWYLMRALHREFGRPLAPVVTLFRTPLAAALPAAALSLGLLALAPGGRGGAVAGLAASALAIGLVYAWLSVRAGLARREFLGAMTS